MTKKSAEKKDVNETRQMLRVSQKVLFFDEDQDKFLIFKYAKNDIENELYKEWIKVNGPYDLPGGHIDEGEKDLMKALAREIKEETGINIDNLGDDVCKVDFMINKKNPINLVQVTYLMKYFGAVILSEEHSEYEWLSAEEISKNKNIGHWIKTIVEKSVKKMELENSLESWQRCMADFDNYKKRQTESQKEFTKYAAEGVISDMLPVLDNFHAATEHIPDSEADNPWVTGIMFIQQQMEKVFEESGVTKIEVNVGDEFDPNIMEAVKNDDREELTEDAKVEKVAQPGYKIGEKILRPALVVLK